MLQPLALPALTFMSVFIPIKYRVKRYLWSSQLRVNIWATPIEEMSKSRRCKRNVKHRIALATSEEQ